MSLRDLSERIVERFEASGMGQLSIQAGVNAFVQGVFQGDDLDVVTETGSVGFP